MTVKEQIIPFNLNGDDAVGDSPIIFERDPVLSNLHAGFGWATVAAGLATGILNPEVAGEDIHEALGYTSAVLAATTLAMGFLAHYGEVGPSFRFSSNNIHAMMGAAGGLLMVVTPFLAPSDAHKALGVLGVATMGMSVAWKIVF